MTLEELLPDARLWLRRSSSLVDPEILQTMYACLKDMEGRGVRNPDVANPLIQQAIKLYCKWQFGYEDRPKEFQEGYEGLRDFLSLSTEYNDTNTCGTEG